MTARKVVMTVLTWDLVRSDRKIAKQGLIANTPTGKHTRGTETYLKSITVSMLDSSGIMEITFGIYTGVEGNQAQKPFKKELTKKLRALVTQKRVSSMKVLRRQRSMRYVVRLEFKRRSNVPLEITAWELVRRILYMFDPRGEWPKPHETSKTLVKSGEEYVSRGHYMANRFYPERFSG